MKRYLLALLLTILFFSGAQAAITLPHESTPSTLVNGRMWTETTGLYARINGATVGPLFGSGGALTATTGNFTDTTDATSSTAAALKTAGGLAVAKKAYIGTDANIGGKTTLTSSSTDSSLVIGSMEQQAYALNNVWLADNIYYNAAYKYRATGYGVRLSMVNGAFDVWTAPSGTAGNTATMTSWLSVSNTGAVSIPGTLAVTTAAGIIASTTSSPASNAACTTGAITWDASYIYVCTASTVWKRAALTGGY